MTWMETLDWLVEEIESRLNEPITPSRLTDENMEPFVVATAWLRLAASYTKAVHVLIASDTHDAAGPIERAMEELWGEFKYLLKFGDPVENARRVHINTVLELCEWMDKAGKGADSEAMEGLTRQRER